MIRVCHVCDLWRVQEEVGWKVADSLRESLNVNVPLQQQAADVVA